MRATGVKRACGVGPATLFGVIGLASGLLLLVVPRSGPMTLLPCGRGPVGAPAAREGSSGRGRTSWTPTNGGASSGARNDLRWGVVWEGVVGVPGPVGCRSGLTSTHSASRHIARRHDRVSGTGLLSQILERGRLAGSCRWNERTRGLVTLPVCERARSARATHVELSVAPVAFSARASVSASRW